MLRKLKSLKDKIFATLTISEHLAHNSIERLRGNSRYQSRKSLIPFGHKIYSQNDEDGITREIFNRIGVTNRVFIEFGIGDGLENNTLSLLFDGWKGLWMEASAKSVRKIKKHFSRVISNGHLKVVNAFVKKDNINELISSSVEHYEIDLLSIDLDGNDWHIFDAITCVKPRVVIIEYNAKFPQPIRFCMDYDEWHVWRRDDSFGASLKFLEINFERKGYCVVGCNLTGTNAFFVRKDLVEGKFLEPFSAENHYEPPRYYLFPFPSGHRPSYETLERSLGMRST